MAETFGDRLAATRGRTTGFDYLRVILSASVILFHSVMTSYGPAANKAIETGWSRPFIVVILPAFFALSGFLVTASLERSKTLTEFLTLRAVRLMPALFFEVVISALILGPILTAFSLSGYLTDPALYRYLLNIVGNIHYQLPGLFLNNPDPDMVNRQLWTIPVELDCYLFLTLTCILGAARHPIRMLFIFAACLLIFPAYDMWRGLDIESANNVPLKVLIQSFIFGVVLFLFRYKVLMDRRLFGLAILLSYMLLLGKASAYVACIPVAYATIFVGLTNSRDTFLSRAGEYSYGLYIYGYVVQQSFSQLFPDYRIWWINCLVCVPVTLLISFASWRLIEKPALDRRKHAVAFVERRVRPVALFFSPLTNRLLARFRAPA